MKNIHIVLFIIIFCIPNITFGMENYVELGQPINTSNMSIVDHIDKKINKAYAHYKELFDFLTLLHVTEKDMLDIIQLTTCHQEPQNLTTEFIDALCKKNIFFNEAINYFSTCVHKNIDLVTYKTIDIVDNPATEQCIPKLNKIPQKIREYIIQKVHDEIDLWYEIPLTHPDTVHQFAIHPVTDRVVTYSMDYTLRIWNLTTGSILFTLAKDNAIDYIKFNQDGSLVATASRYRTNNNDEISYIHIYNIISRTLLHTISHDARVRHMQFTQGSPLTLTTFSKKKINGCKFPIITHWKLHPKKTISHHSQQLQWSDEHIAGFSFDKYAGYVNNEGNTIRIIKKKCAPLYICKQAIHNNERLDTLDNILRSQQYQQLTTYEKHLIIQEIEQEKSWLKNNPMILALTRK